MAKNLTKNWITIFLAFGVLFAGFFQSIFVTYFAIKDKIYLYPIKPHFSHQTSEFFKKFGHTFLASGIVQINSLISSVIATLIPNAVSLLYYGDRISQFPLSLIGTAIGTSILPSLSKSLGKRGDKEEAQLLQESSFFLSFFLGFPSAVGLFTLSNSIVSILFERGEFTSDNTMDVANILKIYAVAVPFFIISKILHSIFYAKKDTKTPMHYSVVSLVINTILSCILVHFYSVFGIAIASVLSTIITTSLLFYKLIKDKIFVWTEEIHLKFLKILYITIIMGSFITCIKIALSGVHIAEVFKFAIAGGISGMLYLLLSQLLGVINIWEIFQLCTKK
jgi:putative peptidoglycan lipid II flippase